MCIYDSKALQDLLEWFTARLPSQKVNGILLELEKMVGYQDQAREHFYLGG
jgi:hypothetical protein